MAVRWPWRRGSLPPQLSASLGPEEHIQVSASCLDGKLLAVSRFGLWIVDDEATRIGWELIAKAKLTARVLSIIPDQVVGELGDGTQVLVDEPARDFTLTDRTALTDAVHTRVRRSVAASRHLAHPGGGGWVVLRRVPGRDGLTRQVRLDPGADPAGPGFAEAVAHIADELAAGPHQ